MICGVLYCHRYEQSYKIKALTFLSLRLCSQRLFDHTIKALKYHRVFRNSTDQTRTWKIISTFTVVSRAGSPRNVMYSKQSVGQSLSKCKSIHFLTIWIRQKSPRGVGGSKRAWGIYRAHQYLKWDCKLKKPAQQTNINTWELFPCVSGISTSHMLLRRPPLMYQGSY